MQRHPLNRRKTIFITARVHAAEVAGSFKMEGILKFLTSNNRRAQALRSLYMFKIVPMLNPEGVLCGNFRCSFTGTDLNRRWDCPDEILHSQVYFLKNLLRKLSAEEKKVLVFCDLHGHSRKLNSFMYGCNKVANGSFCSWTKVRLLPRILACRTPLFSYKDCKFSVESDKQRTARVVLWKELGITNSFTLESSCFGYVRGEEIRTFKVEDYYTIGEELLGALLEYHYVLRSIEQELIITRGWLKPSKLVELTGTPAADVLAKKLAQEKEELKKRLRMSRIKKMIESRRGCARINLRSIPAVGSKKRPSPTKQCKNTVAGSAYNSSATSSAQDTAREHTYGEYTGRRNANVNASVCIGEEAAALPVLKNPSIERSMRVGNRSELDANPTLPAVFVNIRSNKHVKEVKEASEEETPPESEDQKAAPENESDLSDQSEERPSPEHDQYKNNTWRKYFTQEEIDKFAQGLNVVEPNDNDSAGSDSNPSDDGFEIQDFLNNLPDSDKEDSSVSIAETEEKPHLRVQCKRQPKEAKAEENALRKIDLQWGPGVKVAAASNSSDRRRATLHNAATINARVANELRSFCARAILSRRPLVGGAVSLSRPRQVPSRPPTKTDYASMCPLEEHHRGRSVESRLEDRATPTIGPREESPRASQQRRRQGSGNLVTRSQRYERRLVGHSVQRIPTGENDPPRRHRAPSEEPQNISADSHPAPTININIKNVNIQSFPMTLGGDSSYREDRGYNAAGVIGAIPRHDESEKFQQLFSMQNRLRRDVLGRRRLRKAGAHRTNYAEMLEAAEGQGVYRTSHLYPQEEGRPARRGVDK